MVCAGQKCQHWTLQFFFRRGFVRGFMLCVRGLVYNGIWSSCSTTSLEFVLLCDMLNCRPEDPSCHKREMELQLLSDSRSNVLSDLQRTSAIPFTDCFCMNSVKEITETIPTLVNEKRYSFRRGSDSGLIDIMAWKQFIHLSHKLLLSIACALKPELAAIYLLMYV